jgi:hypothetical protein
MGGKRLVESKQVIEQVKVFVKEAIASFLHEKFTSLRYSPISNVYGRWIYNNLKARKFIAN